MADDAGAAARLNESQRRAIAVSLRLLEERLSAIGDLLERDEGGTLYRRARPRMTPEQAAAIAGLLAEIRGRVDAAAGTFRLPAETRDAKATIVALLAMSWQNLGEIDARGMRAYGEVDPALPGLLDPMVQRLMDLVFALEEAVASLPSGDP